MTTWRTLVLVSVGVGMLAIGSLRARSQEAIALTVPVAQPSLSTYTPQSLRLQLSPPEVSVVLLSSTGQLAIFNYPCDPGACAMDSPAKVLTMLNTLNTANLATRSLWRRVMDRLLLDFPGRFQGSATVQ